MKKFKKALVLMMVIACVALLSACGSDSDSTKKSDSKSMNESSEKSSKSDYDLSSDASITSSPKEGAKFGNGQVLTFEYDGSKSNNDPYATLGYDLAYVQDNGDLIPMSGAFLDGKGSGTFKTTDSVFNSSADGKDGIMTISVTFDAGLDDSGAPKGTTVELGRYLVKIETSK